MKVVQLAEVADVNPRLGDRPVDGDDVAFVAMAALDAVTATVAEETRPFREVSKGYTLFRDGDLLVAKITPCFENNKIGQANLSHAVGVGSTEFHVVRPKLGLVDARYLLHFLRQDRVRRDGERWMTGTGGQRRVPAAFLKDLKIALPPLAEQRRIATILEEADALRLRRRKVVARLEELSQSIFFDMFGNPDEAIRSRRTVSLAEVADLRGGRNLVAADQEAVSRNRVLKISAVTSGRFRPGESKPLPDEYEPPLEHFVRSGDLLLSRANTSDLVGAAAYVEEAPGNLVLPDKLWRFVWHDSAHVEPRFVWALLQMPAMRRELSSRASGTGGSMKNISKAKMATLPLLLPELEAQRAFVQRLSAVEETIQTARAPQHDEFVSSLATCVFRDKSRETATVS